MIGASRKIVLLIHAFVRGGNAREAFLLAREFRSKYGIDAEVWALQAGEVQRDFESAGIPVKVLEFRRPGCPIRWVRIAYWFGRLGRVVLVLRRSRVDVLLPLGSWPNVIASLVHRIASVRACVWSERLLEKIPGERLAARFSRRFVANSRAALERLAGQLRVPPARISLIPNGVELPGKDTGADWRSRLGLNDDQLLIVQIGGVEGRNDNETLICAWNIVQNDWVGDEKPVLALAGGLDSTANECRRNIRQLGLQSSVRLLGLIPDVPALIGAADIATISIRSENVPNALLECMAGGVAVVATDTPGIREVLGPNMESILVPPGDPNRLAAALLSCMQNSERREILGRSNRARVETEFTIRDMTDRYAGVIQETLMGFRPTSAVDSSHCALGNTGTRPETEEP